MLEDLEREQHLKYVYVLFDYSILLCGIDNTSLMNNAFRKEKSFLNLGILYHYLYIYFLCFFEIEFG